jgi:hypothetical protein
MKELIRNLRDIWLCIRFPFLYPRNRWTGLHYNNWTIIEFHRKYYKFLYVYFILDIKKQSELPEKFEKTCIKRLSIAGTESTFRLGFSKDSRTVSIFNIDRNKIGKHIKEQDILESGEILDSFFIEDRETIVVSDDAVVKKEFSRFVKIDLQDNIMKWILKILDWINDYPLQLLHCLPGHTELDGMETGWRKSFGIEMMKEIRKQLIKEKFLFKFRITDIKEKYGSLRMYHNGSEEIEKIVDKYEDISRKICLICGKPATEFLGPYEMPYCSECCKPKERKSDA